MKRFLLIITLLTPLYIVAQDTVIQLDEAKFQELMEGIQKSNTPSPTGNPVLDIWSQFGALGVIMVGGYFLIRYYIKNEETIRKQHYTLIKDKDTEIQRLNTQSREDKMESLKTYQEVIHLMNNFGESQHHLAEGFSDMRREISEKMDLLAQSINNSSTQN